METDNSHAVMLPCKPADFSAFISGLLGKPQTISNGFRGAYELRREDIESMHHLLTQRVLQQNNASLIQFTAKIIFDDDSSVLLNSFEDFQHYSEVRPLISTQAHLSWSFLIQFQDRKTPEKQDIDISIITKGTEGLPIYENDAPMFIVGSRASLGYIIFRIKHTARSWGTDIESLLSGHIKNILHPATRFRKFIQKYSERIGLAVATLFFIASLSASFLTAANLWEQQDIAVKALNVNGAQIEQKLDFIISTISSGLWSRYFFSVIIFLIFSFIAAVGLGIWADNTADSQKPSFLLLTKKAEDNRVKILKKYEGKGRSFLLAIFVGIVSGVAANFIFHYMWSGLS
ncbi:MAG: hypothetical protein OQK82_02570 [Candidatus Pacearchaeota archaeon]|nr:hypothetical protein [Candidatus Pacearchaeota archaeon]